MRVFRNVDDRYLNSECLYKVKRLGVHLDYFQSHSGLKFEGLVELCAISGLRTFLDDYAPHQIGQPLPMTGLNCMDSKFSDYDLLMAYVHDGGKLEDLFNISKDGADVQGLVKQLISSSPQAFIIKSGLKPGEAVNDMYVRLVQEVIECFPDQIANVLNHASKGERDRLYINLVSIAGCAGLGGLDHLPINNVPNYKSVCRLAGLFQEGQMPSMYLCELRAHSSLESGTEELNSFLDCTFMSEVFRRTREATNPDLLFVELRNRALAWGMHLKCPMKLMGGFVNQLLASALCTSPALYERAGNSNKNLIGINVNSDLIGLVKTVSDGPFALFVKPDYDISQTLDCLEFLHELDESFHLNDIYDDSGFRHSNAIKILAAIGGHCPGAEDAILNQEIEPENVLALLRALSSLDCYENYSEDSLVKLMSYYVDRLPMMGQEQPLDFLELTGDMRERARMEFKRAYDANPAFKQKFIEKVETLKGLTHEHLRLFSLSGMDLPKTMARTSRRDRGRLIEDEIGL